MQSFTPDSVRPQFDVRAAALRAELTRRAVSVVGSPLSEDLVQSVFLYAWAWIVSCLSDGKAEKDARFRALLLPGGEADFRCYLLYLLARLAADHARYCARHPETPLPLETILTLAAPTDILREQAAIHQRQCELLYSLLARITLTGQQEMCVRRVLDGETQEEIAEELGIRRQTVSNHLMAIKRKLVTFAGGRVDIEALQAFEEILQRERAMLYFPPGMVWDREGMAEQRERRRRRFTREDEEARLQPEKRSGKKSGQRKRGK
jgi:DNA-directed RNA polymerase specialized sigma24 family protein